ncbi:MAG TPA: hypothetical protein VKR83_10435 [Ktedonobacteraceae bacterium]|nr:hypothetical protein [Ktedonobacteraceae bacterium]
MPESGLKIGPLHIRIPLSIYGLGALLIIAAGVAIRIVLLTQGWPHTNSDEGTYGMMAINIAFHGDRPIFMYGQNYMGTIQAYMAAGLFRLFGVSLFNLRLGLVFLFALFLVSMYLLTSLLYTKSMALYTLLLLILGSSYVIYRQTQSLGGWVETLFFGALLYFLASWLALTADQETASRYRKLRLAAYFGWGALVGLCLWSDIVIAPFIFTSGLLLLIFCWRDIRSWAPVLLIVGVLLGGLPMIIYNLHTTLRNDSLLTAIGLFGGGVSHHSIFYYLVHGTVGVLLISLPAISSYSNVCDVSQILYLGGSGPGAVQCTLEQGAWTLVWIALWVSSAFLAIKAIRGLPRKVETRTPEQQHDLVRSYARLGLLIAAAISLFLFIVSPSSTYFPYLSSRYILFVWIATPALVYPLWLGASATGRTGERLAKFINIDFKRVVLVIIALLFLWGTVKTFQEIPATQAANAQEQDLVDNLVHIGAVHIYSDYWTCERVMFQSAGRITCFTVDDYLNTGYERYLPNKIIVTSDPKSSYAFPLNLPQATAIAQRVSHSRKAYHRYVFDGYVIYQPV